MVRHYYQVRCPSDSVLRSGRHSLARVLYSRRMTQPRPDIEAFVRRIAVEVRTADPEGAMSHDAIAAHLNGAGLTTRNGRPWTGPIVEKFLSSPAAQRHYRSNGGE